MNYRGGCFFWFLLMVIITNTPFWGHKNEYGQTDYDVYDFLIALGLGVFSFWLVYLTNRKKEERENKR